MNFEKNTGLNDSLVVVLRGELDLISAPGAATEVATAAVHRQPVIVDLTELTFLDCGALRALLSAREVARQAGGDVLLANPHGAVLRLLTLVAVPDMFGAPK